MPDLTDFQKSVLALVSKIPGGRVATYAGIAKFLGRPKAARAVGNALNKNPDLIKIPCHRVVKSDGQVGGYAAGQAAKVKLLKKEGVLITRGRVIDFDKRLFNFRQN